MKSLFRDGWRFGRLVVLACGMIAVQLSASQGENEKTEEEDPLHEHPTITAMLQTNNAYRAQVGLGAQEIHPELTKAAQDHAWYMARTSTFSHYVNGGPQARAQKYGYPGFVQENIAMGQADVGSTFQAWRASGAHWGAITSNAPHAGFGSAISRGGTPFWVGLYGF